jgi:cytochrome oxidase Cu insertion factor (SCO1/SenC/PrrC family)
MDMNISEFMKKYGKQLPKTYNRITFWETLYNNSNTIKKFIDTSLQE